MMFKKSSAWVPIALSLVAIAAWLVYFSMHGAPEPQADEGVGAHLFQLWLGLEVLMIAYFGVKWLPQNVRGAMSVLLVQVLLIVAGCFPVYYFHL